MATGIYILQFKGTDKAYIGKSLSLENRLHSHVWRMRNGCASKKMQQAYNQYGEPWLEVLQECPPEELDSLERQYIVEFNCIQEGFNTSPGGEAGNISTGESSSRAIFTNDKYLEVLELLVNTNFSRYKIAELTGVTVSIISHISSGEGHKWLEQAAPEPYAKLIGIKSLSRVKRTNNTKRPFNNLKAPDGTIYNMLEFNLKDFCKTHNLTYSKISGVLNGHSTQHKGWVAE